MIVLHPPQRLHVARWEDKGIGLTGDLSFVFVGHLFFMKGGREVLTVFDDLLKAGYPVQLDVVSRLEVDTWASRTTSEDVRWAKDVMAQHPHRIRHHKSLPNAKVMDLFRDAHVALLPSWAETYGYSILEAQACGCPVITTDVGAMPEINGDRTGWVITVPKRDFGEGRSFGRSRCNTLEGRSEISATIRSGLRQTILQILSRRELVRERGNEAIARVRRDHDPAKHTEQLKRIYMESCLIHRH